MRINSRRWQASILLVLAMLIGTSAFSSPQERSSPMHSSGRAGSSIGIGHTQKLPYLGQHSIRGIPGTPRLVLTGDLRFEVEDSRSHGQPAVAGPDLTPPTSQLSERFFNGVGPVLRPSADAPVLSRSARARN